GAIIYTLGQFMRDGHIPSVPVYIDSPLAISATQIFKKNSDYFDQETAEILSQGENPLDLPDIIYTKTTEESKAINEDERPGIIISASGMCDSGRIKHHLKHHLWQEKSHIVFIGYQGEGTIGRRIVDGAESVKLFGEAVAIRAHIHTLGGFSAHADQKGLLEWLSHFENPELEVIVNHGEEKVSMELGRIISERFHLKASIPRWREKRILFGPEEKQVFEEAIEEEVAPAETFHLLLRHLDRNYKRLRRKLKRWKGMGEEAHDPHRLKQLEEVNRRIEDLDSELD
ncbi:MAG: MBL fold metallo-hydrolase, partial [Deltaproteobacteria bacterium]|nr:MBL fold metallo-hydrolase [Deltaproteobacteria bacterium]